MLSSRGLLSLQPERGSRTAQPSRERSAGTPRGTPSNSASQFSRPGKAPTSELNPLTPAVPRPPPVPLTCPKEEEEEERGKRCPPGGVSLGPAAPPRSLHAPSPVRLMPGAEWGGGERDPGWIRCPRAGPAAPRVAGPAPLLSPPLAAFVLPGGPGETRRGPKSAAGVVCKLRSEARPVNAGGRRCGAGLCW